MHHRKAIGENQNFMQRAAIESEKTIITHGPALQKGQAQQHEHVIDHVNGARGEGVSELVWRIGDDGADAVRGAQLHQEVAARGYSVHPIINQVGLDDFMPGGFEHPRNRSLARRGLPYARRQIGVSD